MQKYTPFTIMTLTLLTGCTCGAGAFAGFQWSDTSNDRGQGYVDSQEAALRALRAQEDAYTINE